MKVLIIGGAGFIGANAAAFFTRRGASVTCVDNFSRRGSLLNLRWLESKFAKRITIRPLDIRTGSKELAAIAADFDLVLHLAAQVAVTTSVTDPRADFDINVIGTLNVLEALRAAPRRPTLVYASTNKVYGGLSHLEVEFDARRCSMPGRPLGIAETEPLDFHSPYGCSKGAADQYVRDYARIYGMNNVVFRQSCIYGEHQFGVEDQGWIAWFTISGLLGREINIYGDGKQVRDVLFVDDLCQAYLQAHENIGITRGQVYNIGGGPSNTLSLMESLGELERRLGRQIQIRYAEPRAGDQPIFVADIRKARGELRWTPKVTVGAGLDRMVAWVRKEIRMFEAMYPAPAISGMKAPG